MIPGQAQQFFEAAAAQAGGGDLQIERSLRFNSDDTAHLSRTFSTFTDLNVGTISFWLKRSGLGAGVIAAGWDGGVSYSGSIQFNSSDNALQVSIGGAAAYTFKTNAILRDTNAWYHVVAAWDRGAAAADKVKVWINGVAQTSSDTGYQSWTSGDCQIWASNSGNRIGRGDADRYGNLLNGYLAEYHYVDGQALDESSFGEFDTNNNWNPKAYSGSYGSNGFYLKFADNSSDSALGTDSSGNGNNWTVNNMKAVAFDAVGNSSHVGPGTVTNFKPGTYYNLFAIDTNNVTSNPGSGALVRFNFAALGLTAPATITFDSYEQGGGGWGVVSTNIYTDAGTVTASTTSSGNTRSNTVNIPSGATYFELPGSYNSSYSLYANGIHNLVWGGVSYVTVNPRDVDSMIDSPTNYESDSGNNRGNYATMNALDYRDNRTLSNGNLQLAASTYYRSGVASIGMDSGKFYFEGEIITNGANGYSIIGITTDPTGQTYPGANGTEVGFGWYSANGQLYYLSNTRETYSSYTLNDTVAVAYDAATRKCWIAKNNTWQNSGDPAAGTGSVYTIQGTDTPYFSFATGTSGVISINFGSLPFKYTPPTGFKSLCTQNLSDPSISKPSTEFDTTLWTGTDTSAANTISGLGFSPSLVWSKSRSNAYNHQIIDVVRGGNKSIGSNLTNAEVTNEQYGYIDTFNSDGFTTTPGSSDNDYFNGTGKTYVGWVWDAGSSNTSLSVGDLNSSAYNTSQTWSSNVSGGSGAYGAAANAFDGSLSTNASPEYSSPMTYVNPSASDTVIDTIELYLDIYTMSGITLELNDTDITLQVSTTKKWYTISGFSGANFSKLYWRPTSGNYEVRLYAIRINGEILVDNGVTPPNIPTVASTYRANPTAGTSIVTWTGAANATVGHGLNAAPELVLTKSRTSAVSWRIWSAEFSNAAADYLGFDTNAKGTFGGTYWGDMNSQTIGLGDGTYDNNTGDMVAYCFAPVEGFSSFGSYTGNGDSDGPFVYTGFKVAWLMIKNISTGGETWTMHDSIRDVDNPAEHRLLPNSSDAESTGTSARYKDLLSNGFKIRGTSGEQNTSGDVYIYAAFAEHPFKTARAR